MGHRVLAQTPSCTCARSCSLEPPSDSSSENGECSPLPKEAGDTGSPWSCSPTNYYDAETLGRAGGRRSGLQSHCWSVEPRFPSLSAGASSVPPTPHRCSARRIHDGPERHGMAPQPRWGAWASEGLLSSRSQAVGPRPGLGVSATGGLGRALRAGAGGDRPRRTRPPCPVPEAGKDGKDADV